MAKININKPTGTNEVLSLLSAFTVDNNIYVIFDSEKLGSMGLPIIYVSKYTNKLEKINDANEWQSVKNYLKGIINGTNFEYLKIDENIVSDEVYYTPLTLPQASFELIKNRYEIKEEVVNNNPVMETITTENNNQPENINMINSAPIAPIIPNNDAISNEQVSSSEINNIVDEPKVVIEPEKTSYESNVTEQHSDLNQASKAENNFASDKETFLKACENMFDALISKYQKQLENIEQREERLIQLEKEIEIKLKNANEHLANAEAREVVANIVHDNAQKVMDISGLMPSNPIDSQTGVI